MDENIKAKVYAAIKALFVIERTTTDKRLDIEAKKNREKIEKISKTQVDGKHAQDLINLTHDNDIKALKDNQSTNDKKMWAVILAVIIALLNAFMKALGK